MFDREKVDEHARKELSFWGHVRELLYRFRRMFYSIIVSTIIVMVFPVSLDVASLLSSSPKYITIVMFIIRKLQNDFLPPSVELLPIGWFAPVEVYFFVSLMFGVVLSLPVIVYELYKFVNPALFEHERKVLLPFVTAISALFIFGFALGYMLVIPLTIRMLLSFAEPLNLIPRYEFTSFFSLVVGGLFVCGLIFTVPAFFILLVKAAVLSTGHITRNRKYIYPILIVAISIFDPDPTLITEILIGIPIIILMEVSVIIARRFER